ncbi:MAG: glycosyltransferase [Oscillatoria sp. PMC 1051.18]|nr:glycosyltransferase [Oscillatoria sp. PMC 1050.18]MEC5032835.1 glycosyltransferase [Oscillatoria sp. PMC 1051.18]
MDRLSKKTIPSLPSFSMILETENLANADLNGLAKSLASLAKQTISPQLANEVILIDSGDTPTNLLENLQIEYPWLKIHSAPLEIDYYKAKIFGAEIATGEILVYCDSDCIYETHWLENLLTPFTQENIQIVAGETKTRGKKIYGTAMALAYIFPNYSDEEQLRETTQYFLNNVAFRRKFFLKNPIPTQLPLYRGNCAIHAYNLRSLGYQIWRQPQARATHAPPFGLSHFFWRFLLIGHDYYWQKKILGEKISENDPISGLRGKLAVFDNRVGKLFAEERDRLLYLPFAIPIILAALLLIFLGYLITYLKPKFLLSVYDCA